MYFLSKMLLLQSLINLQLIIRLFRLIYFGDELFQEVWSNIFMLIWFMINLTCFMVLYVNFIAEASLAYYR